MFRDKIDNDISLSKISVELRVLRGLKHENLIEVIDQFDTDHLYCSILPLYVVSSSIVVVVVVRGECARLGLEAEY